MERTFLYTSLVIALALGLQGRARAAGALAIDDADGNRYGLAYHRETLRAAEAEALEECGRGCRIVLRFESGCAAYAADEVRSATAHGWGTGTSEASAQANALDICRIRGGATCIVRAKGCDSR